MNETEKRPESEKNESTQELASKAMSVASEFTKGLNSGWIRDFVTFKIMIVPKIQIFLYLLTTLIVIIGSFAANIFLGILMIFLAPFLVHIVFEFAMLLFAILDILREIRNKLK